MSRLFRKEYHKHSNTWYFKEQVYNFKEDQFTISNIKNEKNMYIISFIPKESIKSFFPKTLSIEYNLINQEIISYKCSSCKKDDYCRHFFSIIQYGYKYLDTSILKTQSITTYQDSIMQISELFQKAIINGKIFIRDLYDINSNKIRLYFHNYDCFSIRLISYYLVNKKLPENQNNKLNLIKQQIKVFSAEEQMLLSTLYQKKCGFSSKNNFFTIYKSDIDYIFPILKTLKNIFIKETGDKLVFSNASLSLTFIISKINEEYFSVSINNRNQISALFCHFTTYILKRNIVYSIKLPLKDDVIINIFKNDFKINKIDLLYFQSIVTKQLELANCNLTFDEDVPIKEIINYDPIVTFNIEKENNSLKISSLLDYSTDKLKISVPTYVINFSSNLVKMTITNNDKWFYISPEIKTNIIEFLDKIPFIKNEILENDYPAIIDDLVLIDIVKKIFFQYAKPEWSINLSEELKNEFIYKIILKPEIITENIENNNWFSYKINYNFKDITFTHNELKNFFKSKEEFLKLNDGRLVFFENKDSFFQIDNFIRKNKKNKENIYYSQLFNAPSLFNISRYDKHITLNNSDFLDKMYKNLLSRKLPQNIDIPLNLDTIMRSYQKNGFLWMKMLQNYNFGGILADDMGLGKTIQAISILVDSNSKLPSIVVCPKTLLFNWANEINKFSPELSFHILEGNKENRASFLENINTDIIITSYNLILNDIDKFKNIKFNYIFLDEAQHIKNPKALRTKAVKKINAQHKIALTGTPMENNPSDLWSIFDFILPNYLPSISSLKKIFFDNEKNKESNNINKLISPFILRRKKENVLKELPDKQEQIIFCKMTPIQEKIYIQIIDSIKNKFLQNNNPKDISKNYLHILAALTKLRLTCNHPHLLENEIQDDPELSGKTALLKEIVIDAINSNNKLLIFSQFVKMLDLVKIILKKEKIPFEYLTGSTKNRKQHINNFNENPKIKAFLISLKAGGFGLNLTAADTVIIIDPWWNPMGEKQAIDRAYRIGQTKKVIVYKLITKDTVEEKISFLQRHKKKLFDNIIEDSQLSINKLNIDDLKNLFEY